MQADLEALPCAFTILTDDITTSTPRYDEEVTDQFCIALATAARSRFPPASLLTGEESVLCTIICKPSRSASLPRPFQFVYYFLLLLRSPISRSSRWLAICPINPSRPLHVQCA